MGHGDAFTAADWLVGVKMDRLNFSETDENSRHFSIALFTILLFLELGAIYRFYFGYFTCYEHNSAGVPTSATMLV